MTTVTIRVALPWNSAGSRVTIQLPLLKQELICEVRPLAARHEFTLELQSRFVPVSESLEFEKTNFEFLAVRVAKSISAIFGGGVLAGSDGAQTQKNLFEQSARWIDYLDSAMFCFNFAATCFQKITCVK